MPGYGMIPPPFLEGILAQTTVCDPSLWTLVQEWDSREGDMSAIVSPWSISNPSGFAWSPDGTKLVVANISDARVYSYTCSTAFDPDTASHTSTSPAITNVTWPTWIKGGSRLRVMGLVGDVIEEWTAGNYLIGPSSTKVGDLNKSEVGASGATDGTFCCSASGDVMYWMNDGPDSGDTIGYIYGATDLDAIGGYDTADASPTLTTTAAYHFSEMNAAKDSWYESQITGVRLITLDGGVGDINNITAGALYDLRPLLTYSWSPRWIWLNPNDTEFVWIGDGAGTGFQLAKFAMNCSS